MDTITQVALGATIAEAGFRRTLGRRAVFWGGLCGALPDADVVVNLFDPWASLMFHRSFSHSLLVLSLAAVGLGWLGHRFGRRQGRVGSWIHLSFWSLVTHPLLDVCTPYGTQLLWPLRHTRFAIDAVNVVDPVYTLPLLALTVAALRAREPSVRRRRWATALLALTTLYLALGGVASGRARQLATEALEGQGVAPVEVRALPTWMNIQVFRVLARDAAGEVYVGHVSVVAPRPIAFVRVLQVRDARAARALASPRGRDFEWFAMGWAVPVEATGPPAGDLLLADERYAAISDPSRTFFGARVHFGSDGEVASVERTDDTHLPPGPELAALWNLLLGR